MASASAPTGRDWIAAVDRDALRGTIGRRALDLALASSLPYARAPWWIDSAIHAVLGSLAPDAAAALSGAAFHVELRFEDGALRGECSRCAQTFGPCLHVGVLALDLACSGDLRSALLEGRSTAAAAA